MEHNIVQKLKRHTWLVCGIYAVIATAWIFLSDRLLAYWVDPNQLTRLQTWKGILFVLVTTLLLFFLIRGKNNSIFKLFRRLRKQLQYFRDTFEQAAVGIVHISKDEKWLRVNRKLGEILGYSRDEFRNLGLEDIVHPDDLDQGRKLDQKLIDGKTESYVTEKRYIHKSGKTIYGRLTKSTVHDSGGELKYLIAVIEDITDQKKAEQKLAESLEQQKLMLAEIHHRVKNNLAIISGLMELQVYNSEDEQVKQILKESMMRIKSMALVHESYYEKGELAHVNVNEYLREFIGYFKTAYYKESYPVDLQFNTVPLKLNINQAIPLGLLLNELLIHAYGDVFRDELKCTIAIKLDIKDNQVIMQIRDNLKEQFEHFDSESNESIGKMIINALLKQLDASLDTKDEKCGHSLTVHFHRENKRGSSDAYMSSS